MDELATQLLVLAAPAANKTYQIHPSIPKQNQRILVEGHATTTGDWHRLLLIQNGVPFAENENKSTISGWWTLSGGTHTIWLAGQRTEGGEIARSDEIVISVEEFE